MTQQAPIAVAIIVLDGLVLMVRRRIQEAQLFWQFPAGAVEAGETSEQAAVRETREETGLVVTPVEALGERPHPANGRTMVYVACEVVLSATPYVVDDDELAEVEWCDRETLAERVPSQLFAPVEAYLDANLS